MNYISFFDDKGRYISSGSDSFVPEGIEPPPIRMPVGAYGFIRYEVDIFKQYHDMEYNEPRFKPLPPSDDYVFNWDTKEWYDPRTINDFKSAKWEEVKAAREAAIQSPLITPFGIFDADTNAQLNILKTVALANNLAKMNYPVEIDFTLYDDTVITLSEAMAVQVGLMLGAQTQAARDKATLLREQIFSDNITPEALAAITWN